MTTTDIDLQKINVKFWLRFPAEDPDAMDWDALLGVFCRWREEEGEELVDLADYAHVPEGPSCILVSKRWQFGVDRSRGWTGLFLSSRKQLGGDLGARFRAVTRSCLEKSQRLLGEAEMPDGLGVLTGEAEVVVNDRLLLPNTEGSDEITRPAIEALAEALYGASGCEIERDSDPSRRLGYTLRSTAAPGLEEAIERLR